MDLSAEIVRLKKQVYFLLRKVSSGGTGGASAFTDLTDVPSSYSGQGTKVVSVKATEDGLEFTAAGVGSGDVTGPASSVDTEIVVYSGTTGKIIKNTSKVLTTVGGNIAALTNPSAVTFIRINADNSVTARSAANFLSDIGAQAAGSYLTASNIVGTITNGVTTNAPSEDAVFDALALKQTLDATLTALAGLATGANKIPYSTGTDTFGQLDFKDEDDMSSDSATALPSQQSVKAYVDTKVVTESKYAKIQAIWYHLNSF